MDQNNPFFGLDPMGMDNSHFAELAKLAEMAQNPQLAAQHAQEMAKMGIPPPFSDMQDFQKKLDQAHKFYVQNSQQNQAMQNAGNGQMANPAVPIMPNPQDLGSMLTGVKPR